MPFHSLAFIDSAFSIVYSSLVQNLVFLSPISGICKNWKDSPLQNFPSSASIQIY
jgi:hypothetical protein